MLEEEIRRLKEARLCKVCLDEDVSIAYIPCGIPNLINIEQLILTITLKLIFVIIYNFFLLGHIVTCVQCAAALDHCPLCRKNIKGTVRIFFS